jgi:hypothetical protein
MMLHNVEDSEALNTIKEALKIHKNCCGILSMLLQHIDIWCHEVNNTWFL